VSAECVIGQRRSWSPPTLTVHMWMPGNPNDPLRTSMSGGRVMAPDAPVLESPIRRTLDIARDLSLAVMLIWSLPLAFAIAVASVRAAVQFLTR